MPDRRSLCDRRPEPRPFRNEAEANHAEETWSSAPVCGACLLVLQSIRVTLAIYSHTAPSVWPPTAVGAAESLADTRWASELDLSRVPLYYADFDLPHAASGGFPVELIERAAADYFTEPSNGD